MADEEEQINDELQEEEEEEEEEEVDDAEGNEDDDGKFLQLRLCWTKYLSLGSNESQFLYSINQLFQMMMMTMASTKSDPLLFFLFLCFISLPLIMPIFSST